MLNTKKEFKKVLTLKVMWHKYGFNECDNYTNGDNSNSNYNDNSNNIKKWQYW